MKNCVFKRFSLVAAMSVSGLMAANATDYYVDPTALGWGDGSSWSEALSATQFAKYLLKAEAGTTFHLAEGVYRPIYNSSGEATKDKNACFRVANPVNIIGGYPSYHLEGMTPNPSLYKTVFEADFKGDDEKVISEGKVSFLNRSDNATCLLSIDVPSGGSVRIENITFEGTADIAKGSPSALLVMGSQDSKNEKVTLRNCTFKDCYSGASFVDMSSVEVRDCEVMDMTGSGVSISRADEQVSVSGLSAENCTNGLFLSNVPADVEVKNSTMLNAPISCFTDENMLSGLKTFVHNTVLETYDSKEGDFSSAYAYRIEGNILGNLVWVKTDGVEDTKMESSHNLYFPIEDMDDIFLGESDIQVPLEYMDAFVDGKMNSSFVFEPTMAYAGGFGKTISVVGDNLRGASVRFDGVEGVNSDQRGQARKSLTMPGAVEYCPVSSVTYLSDCNQGVVVFSDDFGGNSPEDPNYVEEGSKYIVCLKNGKGFPLKTINEYYCGVYSIQKKACAGGQWYGNFDDHTYPGDTTRGNMLQIDFPNTDTVFYVRQVDGLQPGAEMYFTMWGFMQSTLFHDGYDPDTRLKMIVETLDGTVLASEDVVLPAYKYEWEQYGVKFQMPNNASSVVLKLFGYEEDGGTNYVGDFSIDDIELRSCVSKVDVVYPQSETKLCNLRTYTLNASFDEGTCTWYRNSEKSYDPEGWVKVGEGKELKIDGSKPENNGYYRCVASSDTDEGVIDKSSSMSDVIPMFFEDDYITLYDQL